MPNDTEMFLEQAKTDLEEMDFDDLTEEDLDCMENILNDLANSLPDGEITDFFTRINNFIDEDTRRAAEMTNFMDEQSLEALRSCYEAIKEFLETEENIPEIIPKIIIKAMLILNYLGIESINRQIEEIRVV